MTCDLLAKNISTKMKYKTPDLDIQGPVQLEALSSFTYVNKTPVITSLVWKSNFDSSEIRFKDIFSKSSNIRLQSEGSASYNGDLNFESFNLE